mmetsp:Transcript_4176/g.6155  ORF Transcript_4176/g.6155 Transcript_4176/m.6155 type:complete len:317 (+) Transcript_4176:25-975(+)
MKVIWELEQLLQEVQAFEKPKIRYEQYMTTPEIASKWIISASQSGDIVDKNVLDMGTGTGMLATAAHLTGAKNVIGVDIDPEALDIARNNEVIEARYEENPVYWALSDAETFVKKIQEKKELLDETLKDNKEIQNKDMVKDDDKNDVKETSEEENTDQEEEEEEDQEEEEKIIMDPFPTIDDLIKEGLPLEIDTVLTNPPFGTRKKGADVAFLRLAMSLQPKAVYSLHKSSTRDFLLATAEKWGWYGHVIGELRYELPQSYSFHKKQRAFIAVDLFRFTQKKELPMGFQVVLKTTKFKEKRKKKVYQDRSKKKRRR